MACVLTTITTASEFIHNDFSAFSTSLGGADVGLANRADGVLSNPAGLSRIVANNTYSVTSFKALETSYLGLFYAKQLPRYSIGFSVINASINGILITADTNNDGIYELISEKKFTGSMYTVTLAKTLFKQCYIGGNMTFIAQDLVGTKSFGTANDIGLQWRSLSDRYILGASVSNIADGNIVWENGTTESIKQTRRIGWSGQFINQRLTITNALIHRYKTTIHSGILYRLHPSLSIRLGHNHNSITTGLGIELNPFSIDFSYEQTNQLISESIYKLSLSLAY